MATNLRFNLSQAARAQVRQSSVAPQKEGLLKRIGRSLGLGTAQVQSARPKGGIDTVMLGRPYSIAAPQMLQKKVIQGTVQGGRNIFDKEMLAFLGQVSTQGITPFINESPVKKRTIA